MQGIYNFLINKNKNAWIAWVVLYFIITVVIVIRVNVEATGYITPDSFYYLEAAQNILNGIGPYGPKVFDVDPVKGTLVPLFNPAEFGHPEKYKLTYFSVWPLGYPACVAFISLISGTSVFWASKIVNLLFLAFSFLLLYKYFRNTALLAVLYFCSYPLLEIVSYSWSEMGFLFFLLLLIISLYKIYEAESLPSIKYYFYVGIALSSMFLFRYAGFIYFIFTSLFLLFIVYRKQYKKGFWLTLPLLIAGSIAITYLFINYIKGGFITGMPRAATQELSKEYLLHRLGLGLFNQLHLIKQHRFGSGPEALLYIILSLLQLSLLLFWKELKGMSFWKYSFVKISVLSSMLYILFLIALTFTSTIDPFDYRTLSPFSHMIYISLFICIGTHLIDHKSKGAYLYFIGFFIISLIMNLPKHFLIEWVTGK